MTDAFERLKAALADRYTLERVLGEGGMAIVYLADDRKVDRQVAVKVLRPELAAALGAERFLREIAIGSKLSHPNILPVFDSGETDEFLYYVMPFVEADCATAARRGASAGRLQARGVLLDVRSGLLFDAHLTQSG